MAAPIGRAQSRQARICQHPHDGPPGVEQGLQAASAVQAGPE